MNQAIFAFTRFEFITKRTRKRAFVDEMKLVVPCTKLTGLTQPLVPASKTDRPPFQIASMLRTHFMQQCFGLSDPAMEEALQDIVLFREFAQVDAGTSLDATWIPTSSPTKNNSGERDPAMHQTQKGSQWHFGVKVHISADAESGWVHTVRHCCQ
jgi:IS5 family transposase